MLSLINELHIFQLHVRLVAQGLAHKASEFYQWSNTYFDRWVNNVLLILSFHFLHFIVLSYYLMDLARMVEFPPDFILHFGCLSLRTSFAFFIYILHAILI